MSSVKTLGTRYNLINQKIKYGTNNGLIYGIPFDASSCLVIDLFTNKTRADIFGLGGLGLGGGKWLCGSIGTRWKDIWNSFS